MPRAWTSQRVNQAGATPIKPMLAEIDAIKDQASLQQMIIRFADLGVQVPFVLECRLRQSQSFPGDCRRPGAVAWAFLTATTM